MPEGKDEKFKVEDRRTSTREGEVREQPVEGEAAEETAPDPAQDQMPQVDFSTFIFSLFSSALIQLGDMADPMTGQTEMNLKVAKQTIDIIDIIKEKTTGNLDDEEDKLISKASAELKWKYLDAVKQEG
jgi:hypothetical protein